MKATTGYQKQCSNVNRAVLRNDGFSIDIICKIVDNYGDIGVAYRFVKALRRLEPTRTLRLLVDDMKVCKLFFPELDIECQTQTIDTITIVRWDADAETIYGIYGAIRIRCIIECFACNRPDWLRNVLLEERNANALIINLEYLSAEPYAEEFHLMPALTGISSCKKFFFMPGFTQKTGGLILNDDFGAACAAVQADSSAYKHYLISVMSVLPWPMNCENSFWFLVFSYEYDYTRLVSTLSLFSTQRPVLVLAASGISGECFARAWEAAGRPFPLVMLPFMRQELWDGFIAASDWNIVRGEDSLSRAVLAGRPFLWHAYKQKDNGQLVKVRALCETMRPHFTCAQYEHIKNAHEAMNMQASVSIDDLLAQYAEIAVGYKTFSQAVWDNGDLAAHLLEFISTVLPEV